MSTRALLLLSNGFEDIETICPIDVLTRLGVSVTLASIQNTNVHGAWGSRIAADITVDKAAESYDALIIPGGKKNAENLAADEKVRTIVTGHHNAGKLIASICASPSHVLGESCHILKGRRATGDPSFNDRLEAAGAILSGEPVTIDGNIITATGPGSALLFALAVGRYLCGEEQVRRLSEGWGIRM